MQLTRISICGKLAFVKEEKGSCSAIMLFYAKSSGIFLLLGFCFLTSFPPALAIAQEQQPQTTPQQNHASSAERRNYERKVTEVLSSGEKEVEGKHYPYQTVKVQILDGAEKDKIITIKHGEQVTLRDDQKVIAGENRGCLKNDLPCRN